MVPIRSFPVTLAIAGSFLSLAADAQAAEGAAAPAPFRATTLEDLHGPGWKLDDPAVRDEIDRIRQAAPTEPAAKPARPRKLLVYGRKETHPPVPRCFVALEAMGRKSGAFETVWSGDPAAVLPENLRQFDAIVMNNTHERFPFMPRDEHKLPEAEQATLREREAVCQKSLLAFVESGKGIVGLHAANAGVKWPEYNAMFGGQLESYLLSGKGYWIRNLEPKHPLCAGAPAVFEVNDEVYGFNTPADTNPSFSRDRVRVLLELDRERVTDQATLSKAGRQFDYAVSWVKPHGRGRVFYCSLGHWPDAFVNPYILRHWLAGIQFALGDLDASAEPFRTTSRTDLDTPAWRLESPQIRQEIEEIERAAPPVAPAKPAKPRQVLVYGRNETHDGPVQRCFVAIEAMGRRSGAFETTWTGDPAAFHPQSLARFDAVVMNNTHDPYPMLPRGFARLGEAAQAEARERATTYEQSLLDFVNGGKGLVGIHGATYAVNWPAYSDMLGGRVGGGMVAAKGMTVRIADPGHPFCATMGSTVEASDEFYSFPAGTRDRVRVLMELDHANVPESQKKYHGPTSELLGSWVKRHGKGRVFYSSLGHWRQTYVDPVLMKHWLAGIQFALGDLDAPAETPAEQVRVAAVEKAQGGDEAARLQGIAVLGRVGAVDDVPLLARLATTGEGQPTKQAAAKALETIPGDAIGPAIGSLVDTADPSMRAVLLRCLSTRAMQTFCGSRSIDALIGLLPKVAAAERENVARAIAASYRRYPDAKQRARVVALLGSSDTAMRATLLPLVGELGGPESLAAIRQARGDADAAVREAAIRGLCGWPDSTVAAEVLAIAKEPSKPEHRQLAVRSVARMASLAGNERPNEAVAMLREAMALADTPGEKRIVAGQFAKVVSPESLAELVALTSDESLRDTVVRSVIELARELLPTHGADARAAVQKIDPLVKEPFLRQQMDRIMGTPAQPPKAKAS